MIKVCIVGLGNIGKAAYEALSVTDDLSLVGIVERKVTDELKAKYPDVSIVEDVTKLSQKPDVAIICAPSREVPKIAPIYLAQGINTVDSYDIHTTIYDVKVELDKVAKANNAVSIMSAGWDPGSDSVVRALMQSCAPKGITYTNFGPGMSMGHTVAVKAIAGVKAALSMTIPMQTGVHRRMVYVELLDGFDEKTVENAIKTDAYFAHDETHVTFVPDVNALLDMGHGVEMIRKGVSGITQNQNLKFSMSINNPALTGQNLVNCARATTKQKAGAYTMIEIPVIDLLAGEKEDLIRSLV